MTRKSICTMFAVALALGMAIAIPASHASRQICEEWRDYYYNVQTGEFIEWAGEPYWQCWYMDEPVSIPKGNPYGDYRGGWGIPRNPQYPTCEFCQILHQACIDRADRGARRCLDHFRERARWWCVTIKRTKTGTPIGDDYQCVEYTDQHGRPVEDCFGPSIDECVDDLFGVGVDDTSPDRWGENQGYAWVCWQTQQQADLACAANQNSCEERAGGCR